MRDLPRDLGVTVVERLLLPLRAERRLPQQEHGDVRRDEREGDDGEMLRPGSRPDRDHGSEYARVGSHEKPPRLGSTCPVDGRLPILVSCLEAEGVEYVFGVPGEETVDLNESLSRSTVRFVPTRHEQAAAYMADAYGRLTGRAGVCLATLGQARRRVTGVADAFLDRAPIVVLTGQGDLERMHKESHQYIDVLAIMRPITKWNARVNDPAIIPEVVRKAFKVAEAEKPGSTHIELPEDVMAAETPGEPLDRTEPVHTDASSADIARAAELIRRAAHPIAFAGNGAVRGRRPAPFARSRGEPASRSRRRSWPRD